MNPEVLIGDHALKKQFKLCFPCIFFQRGRTKTDEARES